jgi:hypothetical protein
MTDPSRIRIRIRENEDKNNEPIIPYPMLYRHFTRRRGNLRNIMTSFFEDMMSIQVQNLEEKLLEQTLQESLMEYKTQERKPGVKIVASSRLAKKEDTDYTCAICKLNIEEKEKIHQLECNHIYHENCIAQWVMYKSECPVCRRSINTTFSTEKTLHDGNDN